MIYQSHLRGCRHSHTTHPESQARGHTGQNRCRACLQIYARTPGGHPRPWIRSFKQWLWFATLPMGSRSGCAIFETFSEALQYLAQWKGCGDMGVTLDTVRMEARLPRDKLDKCLDLVRSYKDRNHISVIQLESFTGLLNFACRVVVLGRPFLRRLYSLKEGMKKHLRHYKLCLSAGTRQDLGGLLSHYNGVTMFGSKHPLTAGQVGILVATTKEGWRVEKGGQFLYGDWPNTLKSRATEAGAALFHWLVVAKVWGPTLQDTRLVMEVYNDQLTCLVNSQNHKNKWLWCEWVSFCNTTYIGWLELSSSLPITTIHFQFLHSSSRTWEDRNSQCSTLSKF